MHSVNKIKDASSLLMQKKVVVVGMGYVGFPLAIEFGKQYQTIGYDCSLDKIESLVRPGGTPRRPDAKHLNFPAGIQFTADAQCISTANFVIVAVPTPVDKANAPDLSAITAASETVGRFLKRGAIVVFESTVYPGLTEEVCVPIIESVSNLRWKHDFFVGYSPERINPGDTSHGVRDIVKIVAGDSEYSTKSIHDLYASIIPAGVYCAESIKVAEAAKVIENTQRDLNIALVNELAIIFNKLGIDTEEVLNAASTKWNFIPFKPGLVGGHCIGVDPYYLTHKAQTVGYRPEVILAGRRINDSMSKYIAQQTAKRMSRMGKDLSRSTVGVLGVTFKENCPDIRNSKVVDIVRELEDYGCNVIVSDPVANTVDAWEQYEIRLTDLRDLSGLDAVIVAVAHDEFKKICLSTLAKKMREPRLLVDVKSIFSVQKLREYLINVWRL